MKNVLISSLFVLVSLLIFPQVTFAQSHPDYCHAKRCYTYLFPFPHSRCECVEVYNYRYPYYPPRPNYRPAPPPDRRDGYRGENPPHPPTKWK